MITHTKGDLLDLFDQQKVNIMLHVANCQGIMGSGIALSIKNKYPKAYEAYKAYEERDGLSLGTNSHATNAPFKDQIIINLHAQNFYGGNGSRFLDYEALYKCLEKVRNTAQFFHLKQDVIGVPKDMGSCRAGGDFRIVLAMLEVVFDGLEVLVVEYDK